MPKICDHTSVGIIVRNTQGDTAVIKRKNFPTAYALPAGHCDGDSYEAAAIREAREEIGVEVLAQKKIWENRFFNPCRREDGHYHDWRIFEAEEWRGTPVAGSDAKELIWLPKTDIASLAARTWRIAQTYGFEALASHASLAFLLQTNSEWKSNPGLEIVWCIMLTRIGMINIRIR